MIFTAFRSGISSFPAVIVVYQNIPYMAEKQQLKPTYSSHKKQTKKIVIFLLGKHSETMEVWRVMDGKTHRHMGRWINN